MKRATLLLSLALAVPLHAHAQAATARTSETDVHDLWTDVSAYLSRAAVAVPDSSYAYKPASTVRSFGEVIAHVAGSQKMFCAAALGETIPAENAVEKASTSKADIVKALNESNTYCARAYALPASKLTGSVKLFGRTFTKRAVLMINMGHDNEHYGNVVTYMRMLGMVPPSSQPAA